MSLFGGAKKDNAPALLTTEIKYTRSVIHASVQASAGAINEALGVTDPAFLDEFLTTDAGQRWLQGFRDYAMHVLAKTI